MSQSNGRRRTPPDPGRFRMIPLDRLIPTSDNRRDRVTVESVKSLAATMRESGVLQPIVVRPHPDKKGFFEIRAGERRWKAAKVAGLKAIPALVRTLDDPSALAVTLVENTHRLELHPLEEARTIQLAFDRGFDIEAIASKLGCSVRHVARRASLTRLTDAWKQAVRNPESPVSRLSPSHLELVARLPAEAQDRLAAEDFAAVFARGMPPVAVLRNTIDGHLRALSVMPWDVDDDTLVPEVGSCRACAKRSGCHPMLFEHEDAPDADGRISQTDRCLDEACHDRKMVAHLKRVESRIREAHPQVRFVQLGLDRAGPQVTEALGEDIPVLYGPRFVKAREKDAVPVVPISGPRAGKLLFVKQETVPVDLSPTQALKKSERRPLTLAEKQAALLRRRQAYVVGKVAADLRALLQESDATTLVERLRVVKPRLTVERALAMVVAFGTWHRVDGAQSGTPWANFDACATLKDAELIAHAVRNVLPVWVRRMTLVDKTRVDLSFEEARRIGVLLAIDFAALEAEAVQAIPVPKSWESIVDPGIATLTNPVDGGDPGLESDPESESAEEDNSSTTDTEPTPQPRSLVRRRDHRRLTRRQRRQARRRQRSRVG